MINYSEKNGSLTFTVRVVPRASRSAIVGEHDGSLRVGIAAAPVDGAANEELIRTLAQALKVSRTPSKLLPATPQRINKSASRVRPQKPWWR